MYGQGVRHRPARMTDGLIGKKKLVSLFKENWRFLIKETDTFAAFITLMREVVNATLLRHPKFVMNIVQGLATDVLRLHYRGDSAHKLLNVFHTWLRHFERALFNSRCNRNKIMSAPFNVFCAADFRREVGYVTTTLLINLENKLKIEKDELQSRRDKEIDELSTWERENGVEMSRPLNKGEYVPDSRRWNHGKAAPEKRASMPYTPYRHPNAGN